MPVIPLVTRTLAGEEAEWVAALAAAYPEGRVVPLADCSAAARADAVVAIVANPAPADLACLPRLHWIQSLWAGVERLLAELPPDGPAIVRLVDPQLARTMAEAVLAWTLYLHRDMPAYRAAQTARSWQPRPPVRADVRTVGLLGLGQLGMAAAQALRAQGFPVLAWTRAGRALPNVSGVTVLSGTAGLSALLRQAEIVVSLLPLTAATLGLLDAQRFAECRRGAQLINFGRGAVVDEDALLAALDCGRLAHAVLDVFAVEPLPPDSRLWTHPAVTVLPHVSAPTDKASAAQIVAANLRGYFGAGVLPPVVDRARGY